MLLIPYLPTLQYRMPYWWRLFYRLFGSCHNYCKCIYYYMYMYAEVMWWKDYQLHFKLLVNPLRNGLLGAIYMYMYFYMYFTCIYMYVAMYWCPTPYVSPILVLADWWTWDGEIVHCGAALGGWVPRWNPCNFTGLLLQQPLVRLDCGGREEGDHTWVKYLLEEETVT